MLPGDSRSLFSVLPVRFSLIHLEFRKIWLKRFTKIGVHYSENGKKGRSIHNDQLFSWKMCTTISASELLNHGLLLFH